MVKLKRKELLRRLLSPQDNWDSKIHWRPMDFSEELLRLISLPQSMKLYV